ncbi:MAG: 4-hydroxy-3-methylbut-2-enyl diphosphate reductase [Puniceicoccales bacterium]|jgi:4-hydroxy-3-methylbut-2-enyl diphosphate reductase|nr:4-hydroxy-3-methylbut-2-enyl diphosphate reductase [Puniceicoccales bacterium]
MKVFLSKYIGFCEGVRRSIAMSYDEIRKANGNVYTDGDLVHNSRTLDRLAYAGIHKLQDDQSLPKNCDSIIVRAHGVTPARRKMLGALGCRVIDATCPKVLRIAGLIKKYSNEGFHILLAGKADHPEIIGLCGYAPDEKITVLSSAREVSNLKTCSEKIIVLSQTTFESEVFEEIANAVLKRFKDATVKNTICSSTINRQREILDFIQSGCDCIIVVGSKFSNNTKSLYNTATANGCHSLIIKNSQDPELANTKKYNCIGITSGASTDYQDAYEIYERLLLVSE